MQEKKENPEQCADTFRITDRECIVCSGRDMDCKRYRPRKPKERDGPDKQRSAAAREE